MVINWYGEGCFKIQSGELVLLVDPFLAETGLTPPRFKAVVTLHTLTSFPLPGNGVPETTSIMGPGEYEVSGVAITGWKLENGKEGSEKTHIKTCYTVAFEDLRLGFLGHAATTPPPDALEGLSKVDVLFIPAGGAPYLPEEAAAKLVKQINPKIAVASFFKIPGLKRKAGDVKDFLDELDQKPTPQEKLVVKKKDLPQSTQIAVLTI